MKIFISCVVLSACVLLYAYLEVIPQLGVRPAGLHLETLQNSVNYDKSRGKFVNQDQAKMDLRQQNRNLPKMVWSFFFPEKTVVPPVALPHIKPDLDSFLSDESSPHYLWLGHSTFMLRLAGKTLMCDPVFSSSAAPVDFIAKRFQPPVLSLNQLPHIDYIVISHDHYDHLDAETIAFFKDKNTSFYVPLGLSSHLISWGIDPAKIIEHDWWQSTSLGPIRLTCTPAQHFSGRRAAHENTTLWASWVIETAEHHLYFSGDSGYGPHFKEIGEKYGPFDLIFIENGQYNEKWPTVHAHPEEVAKAYKELRAKAMVPIHWGMFNLSVHNWYDPIEAIDKLAKDKGLTLLTPQLGELGYIGQKQIFTQWWKPLIDQGSQ